MGACSDRGVEVGALASYLIDETPRGFVTIGSKWAEIGPSLQKFDDLEGKDFASVYGELGKALNLVAVPGQGSGSIEVGSVTVHANDTFANMERVATDVDNWDGLAAVDFVDNYKTQLPYVADHQFTIISVLIAGLEAQAELYAKARENVLGICSTTLSALEAIDARDAAVGGLALTILGAAGTIALEVISGGTLTPLLVTIAAASEAASVAGTASTINFDTEDPRTVMNKFDEAIGRVHGHFRDRETQIQTGYHQVAQAVRADYERKSWSEGSYPAYKFKPSGFANGPAQLGSWHP